MVFGSRVLFVPSGYLSGNPLSGTSTYNNATFASLGVTPGTYVWTWGAGGANQNFTLIIGPAGVPDAGSTDRRRYDLISDALPFGRLWYDEPRRQSAMQSALAMRMTSLAAIR